MNKKDIYGKFMGYEVTNTLFQCPCCDEWSNSLEWFTFVGRDGLSSYTCPVCKYVYWESGDV